MKKAFTLIEVMIAVVIFFVVSVSVINLISNNRHLINLLIDNNNFSLKSTLAFFKPSITNNYDRVKDFHIKNLKVIDILKKDNIKVKKSEDLTQDFNLSIINIKEIIIKFKAYDKYNSNTVYSIGIK